MSDKLPEWPEELEQPCGLGDVISYYTWAYDAALARMEALVEVTTKWRKHMRHVIEEDELQAVDELIAACELTKS